MKPQKPLALIDRETEWNALQRLSALGRPALGLLYGRRRVGKTFLLRNAWPAERVFYFTAADTTPEFNRVELLRAMAAWSGESILPDEYPTWRTTFLRLLEMKENAPITIILDEYQYLRGPDGNATDSALNAAWETYIYGRGATRSCVFILCGSIVDAMRSLNTSARPLYGRFDWHTHLQPFDYFTAASMTHTTNTRDNAMYYGIYGGTPRYLATLRPGLSVAENITEALLAPDGTVRLQVETALEQESGLTNGADYRAILAAVAEGHTERNTIANAVGMPLDSTFRNRLDDLVSLGYITARRNFGAAPNQPYRYRIADPAQRFYYSFVLPYRHTLTDPAALPRAWQEIVEPRIDGYMGLVFEDMARDAYARRQHTDRLPLIREWGRWEGQDRDKRSIEIDIVAKTADGRLVTGAIKWNSKPVTPALHFSHRAMLERLAASGYKWAHDALAPEAIFLYVSASGFRPAWDDIVKEIAEEEQQQIVRWSLDELYRDDV